MANRIENQSKDQLDSRSERNERLIVYQFFPRILTNTRENPEPWGSLERNGSGKFNDLTPKLLRGLKSLGLNTLWLTGVIEHATKTDFSAYGIEPDHPAVLKGEAGSPYAIKDYYDVNPALAVDIDRRLDEFRNAVKRIHKEGLKVVIDFVPNHTARRYHSDKAPEGISDFGATDDTTCFYKRDNNYYYIPNQLFSPAINLMAEKGPYVEFPAKATGNDCFSAFCGENDWYETVKLNYGRDYGDGSEHYEPVPDTWLKMLHILRYWASLGVDGFRCDMVFMVPLPFWNWVIPQVKRDYPGVFFIGEIYDIGLYRPFLEYGHFDYLYDKVNLYDTLVGIERHNVSAARLTDCWKAVDGIGDSMLNFLENHDEVRFASTEFAGDPARVVPYLVVSAMMSRGPYLIYYGQELGERGEENEGFAGHNHRTTIFDYWSLDTLRRWYAGGNPGVSKLTQHEKWLRELYTRALHLCNDNDALREGGFFDLMYVNLQNPDFDPHSIYCWLRYHGDEVLLLVANFSREERRIKVNIPDLAFEMAGIKEGEFTTEDLLWGNRHKITLRKGVPVALQTGASDALIIPLKAIEKPLNPK
ncbi:MAG: alpha-amylase [Muribaculaceae bacterium]|nr:alpha-amylase [Muribaculaceae bacterium]